MSELTSLRTDIDQEIDFAAVLNTGANIQSAVMSIRKNELDISAYITKTITLVSSGDGIIVQTGTAATLKFQMSAAQVATLDPLWPYYLYSVEYITDEAKNNHYFLLAVARLRAVVKL